MNTECRRCGAPLPPPAGPGRPRVYCSRSCLEAHRKTQSTAREVAVGRAATRVLSRLKSAGLQLSGTGEEGDPPFDGGPTVEFPRDTWVPITLAEMRVLQDLEPTKWRG